MSKYDTDDMLIYMIKALRRCVTCKTDPNKENCKYCRSYPKTIVKDAVFRLTGDTDYISATDSDISLAVSKIDKIVKKRSKYKRIIKKAKINMDANSHVDCARVINYTKACLKNRNVNPKIRAYLIDNLSKIRLTSTIRNKKGERYSILAKRVLDNLLQYIDIEKKKELKLPTFNA
jgi:hypothetical protein